MFEYCQGLQFVEGIKRLVACLSQSCQTTSSSAMLMFTCIGRGFYTLELGVLYRTHGGTLQWKSRLSWESIELGRPRKCRSRDLSQRYAIGEAFPRTLFLPYLSFLYGDSIFLKRLSFVLLNTSGRAIKLWSCVCVLVPKSVVLHTSMQQDNLGLGSQLFCWT